MSDTTPSDNGVEPICRHQSIASANEVFRGVADPALLLGRSLQVVLRLGRTCKFMETMGLACIGGPPNGVG